MPKPFDEVLELNVELRDIEPRIWRRIQVPATFTYWDLHCAIQDAMGWQDTHLHAFVIGKDAEGRTEMVGVPDRDSVMDMRAGWDLSVREHLREPGDSVEYLYDFGDGWDHSVTVQKVVQRDSAKAYPRCIGGRRACPPEDCGGVPGYQALLDGEPDAREAYPSYDPTDFDPQLVTFNDSARRLARLRR